MLGGEPFRLGASHPSRVTIQDRLDRPGAVQRHTTHYLEGTSDASARAGSSQCTVDLFTQLMAHPFPYSRRHVDPLQMDPEQA